jgi:enoyl-CoA hydratase/carnithine racemase
MIDLSVAGKVASITLQNPQKHNALSCDMLHTLHETIAFILLSGAR